MFYEADRDYIVLKRKISIIQVILYGDLEGLNTKAVIAIILLIITVSLFMVYEIVTRGSLNTVGGGVVSRNGNKTRIIVLVDNNKYGHELETAWGISICIEKGGKTILFDTGPSPEVLIHNSMEMGANLSSTSIVLLSHEHGDHIGGISALDSYAHKITVYVPHEFPIRIIEQLRGKGYNVVIVNNTIEIMKNVYILKPLYGPPWEQALILNTSKGLVIITGCSHPGILNIVIEAIREFNKTPYMVIGGFHLIGLPLQQVEEIADQLVKLRVHKIYPLHCSGNRIRRYLAEKYPQYYGDGGVGLVIELSN